MELIKVDETDEQVTIERVVDHINDSWEDYTFEKNGDTWELVGFQDAEEYSVIPPTIKDVIKEEIEERYGVTIEVAPIYPLRCPDCDETASARVEVEKDERGYERPAEETKTAKCWMCGQEKEMEVRSNGVRLGRAY